MKVATRIGLSLAIGIVTVLVTTVLMLGSSWSTLRYVQRTRTTYQQVLALNDLHLAVTLEHRALSSEGPEVATHAQQAVDNALARIEEATAREAETGDDREESEALFPRLVALNEQVRQLSARDDARAELSRVLDERDALIEGWLEGEHEEFDASATQLHQPLRNAVWIACLIGLAGVSVMGLVTTQLIRSTRRSLDVLGEAARRIGRGQFDQAVGLAGHDELAQLGKTLSQVMVELADAQHRIQSLGGELQERNRRLAEALESARASQRQAERANEAKDGFLANMSHELRTPLNAILGYAELVRDDLEEMRHPSTGDCERIITAGRLLLDLINDVLDVSKLASGRIELVSEWFDLGEMVREIAHSVQPLAQKNDDRLTVQTRLPGRFHGDALRMRQVLLNLAANAAKFTRSGHVIIRAEAVDGGVVLEVEDNGIGIPQEKLQAIFEPFVQADPSTTRRFGGTGLGLTIARQLTDLMGGALEVDSALGVGSVFRIRIPGAWEAKDELSPSP